MTDSIDWLSERSLAALLGVSQRRIREKRAGLVSPDDVRMDSGETLYSPAAVQTLTEAFLGAKNAAAAMPELAAEAEKPVVELLVVRPTLNAHILLACPAENRSDLKRVRVRSVAAFKPGMLLRVRLGADGVHDLHGPQDTRCIPHELRVAERLKGGGKADA